MFKSFFLIRNTCLFILKYKFNNLDSVFIYTLQVLKEFKLIRGISQEGIEGYVRKTEEMVKDLCELDEEDDKKMVKWIPFSRNVHIYVHLLW